LSVLILKEVKEEIAMRRNVEGSFKGYQALGENVTRKKKDWHEAIDFIKEVSFTLDHLTVSF